MQHPQRVRHALAGDAAAPVQQEESYKSFKEFMRKTGRFEARPHNSMLYIDPVPDEWIARQKRDYLFEQQRKREQAEQEALYGYAL